MNTMTRTYLDWLKQHEQEQTESQARSVLRRAYGNTSEAAVGLSEMFDDAIALAAPTGLAEPWQSLIDDAIDQIDTLAAAHEFINAVVHDYKTYKEDP